MKSRLITVLAVVTAAVSLPVIAQQAPKPEQLIKWRQSAYQVIAWNTGRIKASVEGTYDKDVVQRSAGAIAALANAGLGSLYAEGTDKGNGWHETRARPEIFTDKKVAEVAGDFLREANELNKIAANGDPTEVKKQFGKLTKTCKACHDDYRLKD